jgi:hypothetical protein
LIPSPNDRSTPTFSNSTPASPSIR